MLIERSSIFTITALAALCAAAPAHSSADALIEGARLCTRQFPLEEKQNNIPTHLLAAIATTESGRWHDGLGMSVPWPWTINVDGKGYYFASKAEAIARTRNFLAQGRQSIDVGCMQVNLKHHPKAFSDLNQAFDPVRNVAYSAKFLRDNYATLGDWIKATAAYHSRTPVYGKRYLGEIERNWNRIVGKVAAARAGIADDGKSATIGREPMPRVASSRPRQDARRARVIQVRDEPRRGSAVMVARTQASAMQTASSMDMAAAQSGEVLLAATPSPYNTPSGNSVRRVNLDRTSDGGVPVAHSAGTPFVFAN